MALDPQKTHWFNDGKYGLFIHFGVYSMLGANGKAKDVRYCRMDHEYL